MELDAAMRSELAARGVELPAPPAGAKGGGDADSGALSLSDFARLDTCAAAPGCVCVCARRRGAGAASGGASSPTLPASCPAGRAFKYSNPVANAGA